MCIQAWGPVEGLGSSDKKELSWLSWGLGSPFVSTQLCSPPCSSVHRISQARILEWVAITSSRGSSQPRDPTSVSCVPCIAGRFFTSEGLWKPPWGPYPILNTPPDVGATDRASPSQLLSRFGTQEGTPGLLLLVFQLPEMGKSISLYDCTLLF